MKSRRKFSVFFRSFVIENSNRRGFIFLENIGVKKVLHLKFYPTGFLDFKVYFFFPVWGNPPIGSTTNTLKEHQTIPTKTMVSKDSDNSFNIGIYEKIFF